jgi:hypothetical protein
MRNRIIIIISLIYLIPNFLLSCSNSITETVDPNPKTKSNNDYYENGNIRIERKRLENGDSLWIFKQEDGGCWEENYYRNGEVYKKAVYNSDCTKSAEYELKNGNRNGKWISYHENGKIREQGIYRNGIPDGTFMYYDSIGKIVFIEENFILDSISQAVFSFENDLKNFQKLKQKVSNFKEEDNVEVAGDEDYLFPEISFNQTFLQFDLKEENKIIACIASKIEDDFLTLFGKLKVGRNKKEIETFFKLPETTADCITVYDLKNSRYFKFKITNSIIKSMEFQGITKQN